MRGDAQIAWNGLDARSPYRATMLHVQGVSYLLEGDPARAEPILARAFDVAMAAGAAPFAPLVLAERSIAASESDDWMTAGALSDRACAMVQDGHFEQYWTSALVYAWAARMALHRGRIIDAQQLVTRAAHLRPLLSYALPVVSVQALLELARSYLALGDHSGARAVLRQTHDIVQQRPDLGILTKQLAELKAQLTTTNTAAIGASSLTAAELRLLPLLSTHLSLGEIGDRLYLSRNTVKTHASSVYRKFGVSSRSEAIERMHELGMFSPG